MLQDWIDPLVAFIETHRAWASLVFGALAFGESLAFIGLLVPATAIMLAAGTLVGAGTLSFWELWIGGTLGAAVGDMLSFYIGRRLGPTIHTIWPFRTRPHLLAVGERVFAAWGWAAVFFGRFIGPLRATVPLAAGVLGMRNAVFQTVNIASAVLWIPVLIAPGAAFSWVVDLAREGRTAEAVALGAVLLAAILAVAWAIRRFAPRLLGNADGG